MAGLRAVSAKAVLNRLAGALAHVILHVRGPWIGVSVSFWVLAVVLVNLPSIRRYNPKIWYWLMHLLWMIPLSVGMVDGLPVFVAVLHPATTLPPTVG